MSEKITDQAPAALPREKVQQIARTVHNLLPDGFGFVMVITPFGDGEQEGSADYVSNCKREDAIKCLKTLLFRWGINEEWMKEAK